MNSCPISNKRTSKNAARLAAFINVVILGIYLLTGESLLLYLLTIDFIIKAVNISKSPLSCSAMAVVQGSGIDLENIDALPKQFAVRLGFIILLSASLLSLAGFSLSSNIFVALFVALTFLEFAFNFCVGCYMYTFYLTLISSSKLGNITRILLFVVSFIILFLFIKALILEYTKEQSYKEIELILQTQLATRNYINTQQKVLLQELKLEGSIEKKFYDPRLMSSSFITRSIHANYNRLRKLNGQEELHIKIAAIESMNAKNRANKFELALIEKFNKGQISEYRSVQRLNNEAYLYVALGTEKITTKCLQCHGDIKRAPIAVSKYYAERTSFSQRIGDIPAIISISMPLSSAMQKSKSILYTIFFSMMFIFLVIYFAVEVFVKSLRDKESLARQLQEATQVQKVNLQDRVERLVYEYEKSQEILQQQSKLATMGEMLASITHQWKQPISTMQAVFLNLELDEMMNVGNDEKYKEGIESIKLQVQFMLETMDDFKDFLRPDKEHSEFELRRGVDEVFHLFRIQYKNMGLSLEMDWAPNVVVKGYYNEYRQVILNLINNARDAYDENNIREKIIEVAIYVEDTHGVIEIKDRAKGIPQELFETIFDPYVSTKEATKGTGIGLYMAKTIIEDNMGGELSVHNTDLGAAFVIKLPLVKVDRR